MLARLRTNRDDEGFTLIELLVVMIIIGILAAIAIPTFLNQRKKAQDSAAKADVSTIGKELATYFVDNAAVPTITKNAAGRYIMTPPAVAPATSVPVDLGKASTNVDLGTMAITDSTTWCVSVKNLKGDKAVVGYKYSAADGLADGPC